MQSLQTQVTNAGNAVTDAQATLTTATAQVNSLIAQLAVNPLSVLLQQQLIVQFKRLVRCALIVCPFVGFQ